jgi:hypothetical protein
VGDLIDSCSVGFLDRDLQKHDETVVLDVEHLVGSRDAVRPALATSTLFKHD